MGSPPRSEGLRGHFHKPTAVEAGEARPSCVWACGSERRREVPTGPQLLAFTVLSLTTLGLFRGPVLRRFQQPPSPDLDPLVGSLATPAAAIEAGAVGRVEVRGTAWNARNVSGATLAAGQRCVVTQVDGLLLSVRPE